MSAVPGVFAGAAQDLTRIGASIGSANSTAATSTTQVAVAGEDEVSAAIAGAFGSYGQQYQALIAHADLFHDQFVQTLTTSAGAYATTEAGNAAAVRSAAAQLASPVQALQNLAQNETPNAGFGNVGFGNFGLFNAGIGNVGIGNAGYLNGGIGNISVIPDFNNPTPNSVTAFFGGSYGILNAGSLNFGIGNAGFLNFGIGNLSPNFVTVDNSGNVLFPVGNTGIFNNGMLNQGIFNTGLGNTGIGNTGTFNAGIGVSGTGMVGIGPLAFRYTSAS